MLVATTFRTPDEAVALANNTRYGLAASVWTENVNRALEVAARIKAGVVWINSTNLFDAASGFGGYRESGFGREGGREGMVEYRVADAPQGKPYPAKAAPLSALPGLAPSGESAGALDRTAKLYVGGKQARPDSGYSYAVLDPKGREIGLGRPRQPQGRPQRGRGGGQGVVLGRGDGAQPRAGALLRRREFERPRGRVRQAPARHDRRLGARRRRPRSTRRSGAPSSMRASPTSSTARSTRRARASSRWR